MIGGYLAEIFFFEIDQLLNAFYTVKPDKIKTNLIERLKRFITHIGK